MDKEERKKKKLILMRKESPRGRGQTTFPKRRCSYGRREISTRGEATTLNHQGSENREILTKKS
jgi:hypothetical protein